MAEAFAALSAVAAILQLVDFGTKVLAKTHELKNARSDALTENVTIEVCVTNLQKVADELATAPAAIHGLPSKDQSQVESLINACRPLCKDLLAVLERLKKTHDSISPTWDALRKGVRMVLNKGKLASLQSQLDSIGSQIELKLLSMLRYDQSAMYSDLRQLHTTVRAMKDESLTSMDDHRQKITDLSRQLGERSDLCLSELSEHFATHSLELQQIRDAIKAMQIQSSQILQKDAILQSLLFPQFCDRKKAITEAHAQTFEWIFQEQPTGFKNWLREEDGIFWISGKAGSGKSTLMKLLARHPMTETLLKQWTGDNRLVMAEFYFWSTGHPLEKTQEGLLQSLLFQLLLECHELIPSVCATRWKQRPILGGFKHSWECSELVATINAVLSHPSLSMRFCLFIDGIDEYQGDHGKLVQDFIGFSKYSSVKICASSRPWTVFEKSFGTKPGQYLTLEKLTKDDIDRFVTDTLIWDDRFAKFCPSDGTAAELTDEIRNRADGVFLWVVLVVRSLLRGIDNGDDMATLRRRLSETPSDLYDLFEKMLFGRENVYRSVAARALQLSCHADKPIDPILFCFVQQDLDDPTFALQHHKRELKLWRGRAEGSRHMNNWCHGLLEIEMKRGQLDHEGLFQDFRNWPDRRSHTARFFHRTVKDFLTTSEMQSTLSKLAGQNFNPWSTLCRLSLVAAKCIEVSPDVKKILYLEAVYAVQSLAILAFYYARRLEVTQNRTEYVILQEFDTVFDSLARAMKVQNVETTDHRNSKQEDLELLLDDAYSESFLPKRQKLDMESRMHAFERGARSAAMQLSPAALGAQFDLRIFLLEFIRKQGPQNPSRGKRTLIYHTLVPCIFAFPMLDIDEYPPLDTVRFLKEQGCTSHLSVDNARCCSKFEIHQLLLRAWRLIRRHKGMEDTSDESGLDVRNKEAERKGRMIQIGEILTTSSEPAVVSTRTVPPIYAFIIEWLKTSLPMRPTGSISIRPRARLSSWLAATENRLFAIPAAFVALTIVLVLYLIQLSSGAG